MIKSLYVSGYRPHELGIFNEKHPGIAMIKKAIENELRALIDDGLEWVVISGQQGVETWTAEVVIQLKKEFPQLKYSIITPFLDIEKIGMNKNKKNSSISKAKPISSQASRKSLTKHHGSLLKRINSSSKIPMPCYLCTMKIMKAHQSMSNALPKNIWNSTIIFFTQLPPMIYKLLQKKFKGGIFKFSQ